MGAEPVAVWRATSYQSDHFEVFGQMYHNIGSEWEGVGSQGEKYYVTYQNFSDSSPAGSWTLLDGQFNFVGQGEGMFGPIADAVNAGTADFGELLPDQVSMMKAASEGGTLWGEVWELFTESGESDAAAYYEVASRQAALGPTDIPIGLVRWRFRTMVGELLTVFAAVVTAAFVGWLGFLLVRRGALAWSRRALAVALIVGVAGSVSRACEGGNLAGEIVVEFRGYQGPHASYVNGTHVVDWDALEFALYVPEPWVSVEFSYNVDPMTQQEYTMLWVEAYDGGQMRTAWFRWDKGDYEGEGNFCWVCNTDWIQQSDDWHDMNAGEARVIPMFCEPPESYVDVLGYPNLFDVDPFDSIEYVTAKELWADSADMSIPAYSVEDFDWIPVPDGVDVSTPMGVGCGNPGEGCFGWGIPFRGQIWCEEVCAKPQPGTGMETLASLTKGSFGVLMTWVFCRSVWKVLLAW